MGYQESITTKKLECKMNTMRNITMDLTKIGSPFLLAFLSGCTSFPNTDILFHEVAVQANQRQNRDKSFDLPFNAYVVGVEKANRTRVGSIAECTVNEKNGHCLNINANYYVADETFKQEIRDIYSDQYRPTFISHIAKFSTDSTANPCFIFNIYDQSSPCQGALNVVPQEDQYVSKSWDVLSQLGDDISNNIEATHPTHFVVYVMGWNTPQWEAIKNYRDLFGSLSAAAKEHPSNEFRPVFIGITWPSTGSPALPGADFGIKARDADEVGMIWGNILVNRVLADLKAKYRIPIVVVGHSFGARVSSRAVFSSPLISADAIPHKNVDLLLGLQGAYSFQRYIEGAGTEGSPYRDFSKMVGKAVLTSSSFDQAITMAEHGDYYVGSIGTYNRTHLQEYLPYFEHTQTNDKGQVNLLSCDSAKIAYVDASSVINQVQPGTSPATGAHSFIYGVEIGRLTFDFISQWAKPTQ
jgi:hypothetical protein